MSFILQPWQLLLVILAGWMNQLQQQIIEFQRKEIEVLKRRLGKKRIILSDDERRVLAMKAKVLSRKVLQEIGLPIHAGHAPAVASGIDREEMGL